FLLYQASETRALLTLMDSFDSFDDWPWPFLYKEAYERFPDSKFVLTTRATEEVWFQSLASHVDRGAGNKFKYRKYIYGYDNPTDNKPLHISRYLSHNAEVREYFSDKAEAFLE